MIQPIVFLVRKVDQKLLYPR